MRRICEVLRVMTDIKAITLQATAAVEVPLKVDICILRRLASSPAKIVMVNKRPEVVMATRGNTMRRIKCPMIGTKASNGRIRIDQQPVGIRLFERAKDDRMVNFS
jgi:hypothetical protein